MTFNILDPKLTNLLPIRRLKVRKVNQKSHIHLLTQTNFVFFSNLKHQSWQFDDTGTFTHPTFDHLLENERDLDKCVPYILHHCEKMLQRGYQTEIGDFVTMINFNGYYDVKRKRD